MKFFTEHLVLHLWYIFTWNIKTAYLLFNITFSKVILTSRPLSGLGQFLTTESHLKIMKNAFYFILKVLYFLRYLHFPPNFLVMQEKGLIRKLKFVSKLMTSNIGKQIITIYTFPNISRSKDNQEMKLGQLIDFNMDSFFFKSHTKNEAGRLAADIFFVFQKCFI